jgi:glucose dehydrogenase
VNPESKARWLAAAEVFDSWRVVPRLIVFIYLGLLLWITVYFSCNYFALPPPERGAAVTAFASVVLTASYGAFPFVVKIYMDNGRDWDARKDGPQA